MPMGMVCPTVVWVSAYASREIEKLNQSRDNKTSR